MSNARDAVLLLWAGYATVVNVTLFLLALCVVARLSARGGPALRARVWSLGAPGMLIVAALCTPWYAAGLSIAPVDIDARVLPGIAAFPMMALAGSATAQRAADVAAVAGSPLVVTDAAPAEWALVLVAMWAGGALLLLARLVRGWIFVARLTRAAAPLVDGRCMRMIEESRAVLRIRRRVEMRTHAAVAVPLTWGVVRPILLLPESAVSWRDEDCRAVMLHELAHIRRLDWPMQLISRVACALFWFHPFAWLNAQRLEAAREEACDQDVLAAHVRPSDYADCLLRVADLARLRGAAASAGVSLGMARPTRLQLRLHAILAPHATRTREAGAAAMGVIGSIAVLVVVLGSARIGPHPDVYRRALSSDDWARRTYALIRTAHAAGVTQEDAPAFVNNEPDPRVRFAAGLLIGRPH